MAKRTSSSAMAPSGSALVPDSAVGVDAGGTWVRAALHVPGHPRLRRARRRASSGDPLESILRSIFSQWKLRRCDRLTVGTRGVWTPRERRRLAQRLSGLARRVRVVSDLELAHEACLGAEPGILVVSGTGSAAYGVDDCGHCLRAGGLGPLLGDAGSAFWIGRRWLKSRSEREKLAFARRSDVVRSVSALARVVLRRAKSDARAARILDEAAEELAALALHVTRELHFTGPVRVSWWGGMFKDRSFRKRFLRRLRRISRLMPMAPAALPEDAAAQVC